MTGLAVTADDRVVLVGRTEVTPPGGGAAGRGAVVVARLTADGVPDPTFNGGQLRTLDIGMDVQSPSVAAPAAGGTPVVLVLVRERTVFGEMDRVVVARVRADGAGTDPAFGTASYTDPATGRAESFTVVAAATAQSFLTGSQTLTAAGVSLVPGGDVVAAVGEFTRFGFGSRGSVSESGRLVRVRGADGAVDAGFGTDGSSGVGIPSALAVDPDGHVVVVGTAGAAYEVFQPRPETPAQILRVAPDGRTADEFSLARGTLESAGAAAFDAAGRLVVAGVTVDGVPRSAVARLLWPAAVESARPALVGGPADGTARALRPTAAGYAPADPTAALPGVPAAARTAVGDVTGDGVDDLIAGTGPGVATLVRVLDGATGAVVAGICPFEAGFTGGVFVAAADLDGDGKAEVVVTPDRGGGPVVAGYSGAGLTAGQNDAAQLTRFYGIDDPAFRGGARAAAGDLTGDGKADLAVSAGFLGGPRIALFDGAGVLTAPAGQAPPKLVADFFAFEGSVRNGAFVAAGDMTGDGKADLAFGGGPGGGPRIRVFDGAGLLAAGPFGTLDEAGSAQVRTSSPATPPYGAGCGWRCGTPTGTGGPTC